MKLFGFLFTIILLQYLKCINAHARLVSDINDSDDNFDAEEYDNKKKVLQNLIKKFNIKHNVLNALGAAKTFMRYLKNHKDVPASNPQIILFINKPFDLNYYYKDEKPSENLRNPRKFYFRLKGRALFSSNSTEETTPHIEKHNEVRLINNELTHSVTIPTQSSTSPVPHHSQWGERCDFTSYSVCVLKEQCNLNFRIIESDARCTSAKDDMTCCDVYKFLSRHTPPENNVLDSSSELNDTNNENIQQSDNIQPNFIPYEFETYQQKRKMKKTTPYYIDGSEGKSSEKLLEYAENLQDKSEEIIQETSEKNENRKQPMGKKKKSTKRQPKQINRLQRYTNAYKKKAILFNNRENNEERGFHSYRSRRHRVSHQLPINLVEETRSIKSMNKEIDNIIKFLDELIEGVYAK